MQEDTMKVLANARIFDGRSMLPGVHDVTLDGKRIASVNPHAGVAADAVDLRGMTLMPGLISCHLHPDFFKFEIGSGDRPDKDLPPGVLMAIGLRTCRVLLEATFPALVGAACGPDTHAHPKQT